MTDLSPAAQAVLDAAFAPWETTDTPQSIAAAAICALADQVVPDEGDFLSPGTAAGIRAHILAIATELEGQ